MKKFLLSLFIVPLLLIGSFSSANVIENLSLIGTYNIPDDTGPGFALDNYGGKTIKIDGNFNKIYGYIRNSSVCHGSNNILLSPGETFDIPESCMYYFSCYSTRGAVCPTLPLTVSAYVVGDGSAILTPVITGISDVTTEFIPYVVYIGIGSLLVTLGFIAVKWLVNWLVRKITVIFKSKRG